ncbi:MAG TPA: hypothetical protein VLR49_04065 [Ferruginibacter sp.]|nr:hypothetical protein [Ferruginibacter sp.]
MSSQKKNTEFNDAGNQVNEPQADYEKAELDLLRDGIKRTYTQRFETMMQLIKVGIMIKNAKIIHKPDLK